MSNRFCNLLLMLALCFAAALGGKLLHEHRLQQQNRYLTGGPIPDAAPSQWRVISNRTPVFTASRKLWHSVDAIREIEGVTFINTNGVDILIEAAADDRIGGSTHMASSDIGAVVSLIPTKNGWQVFSMVGEWHFNVEPRKLAAGVTYTFSTTNAELRYLDASNRVWTARWLLQEQKP